MRDLLATRQARARRRRLARRRVQRDRGEQARAARAGAQAAAQPAAQGQRRAGRHFRPRRRERAAGHAAAARVRGEHAHQREHRVLRREAVADAVLARRGRADCARVDRFVRRRRARRAGRERRAAARHPRGRFQLNARIDPIRSPLDRLRRARRGVGGRPRRHHRQPSPRAPHDAALGTHDPRRARQRDGQQARRQPDADGANGTAVFKLHWSLCGDTRLHLVHV
mmetsp:Transcript_7904/g.24987  ORF Transcript_7904/g.24987 Transcript_7904/m.24987 type:complete len:226 (+) Transcript_7904:288-965(+)